MSPRTGDLQVLPDASSVARAAAESFVERAAGAVAAGGVFTAVLTGGSSPRESYGLLASGEVAARVPWERVHLFWGDERCVPPGHPRSNFGMARTLLLSRVPIPPENVHRICGEMGSRRAAREYAAELRDFFGADLPRFDLVHLGIGDDGHVASLFPFDLPRLLERNRLVLPAMNRALGEPRVTLTLPVINAAARVEMLLPGGEKAAIARRAIDGPLDPLRIPAQLVRPLSGNLTWFLAREAARNLRAEEAREGRERKGSPRLPA